MKQLTGGGRAGGRKGPAGILAALLVLVLALVSCGGGGSAKPVPDTGQPPAGVGPKEAPAKITLYFGDQEARWLVPEEREVPVEGRPPGEIVLTELIKGPAGKGLVRTIPEGTRLLSLSVAGGVARVNFSREFQTRHWGGTSGETFTVYSVVNSLAVLEGINKVQFLVEGNELESLAGHIDLSGPVSPDRSLIKP